MITSLIYLQMALIFFKSGKQMIVKSWLYVICLIL